MSLRNVDVRIIHFFRKISIPLARFGLFVVFFWFGFLKVLGLSPAGPLVEALFNNTIATLTASLSFATFYAGFGILECAIGILFIIRGFERVVIPLLFLHMATTALPLFLLTPITWSGFMIPTLEGQYIIKNLLIVAAAITIAAHLDPWSNTKRTDKPRNA